MLSKKEIKMYEDAIQHTLIAFISVLQVIAVVLGVYELVYATGFCYNDLILIGGVVFIVEILLSILRNMAKHTIWFRVIVPILLFAFPDIALLAVFHGLKGWLSIVLVVIITLWMRLIINKAHSKIVHEKNRDTYITRLERQTITQSAILGLIVAVIVMEYAGGLQLDGLDISYNILIGIASVLLLFLMYLNTSDIMHRQIIETYKKDADVQELLTTYKNGSVFLSYPITSQAIGDLLDFHILRVRNPKAASLSSDTGAWYTLSKTYYDRLTDESEKQQ